MTTKDSTCIAWTDFQVNILPRNITTSKPSNNTGTKPGMTTPIPSPPGLPILGNATDIDPNFPLGSMLDFANKYGEIFQLNFAGRSVVFVTTQALIHELCDEKRFQKGVNAALKEVRNGVHDGLFTARIEEPNWGMAHRILMPAFGPMSIQGMFPEMHEIASQLALKWARHGSSTAIMVTDDFTRLTLDTLALCAMDFRFNSYYHDEMHPFITAMGDFLTESGARSRRPGFTAMFYRSANQKYWEDIGILRKTAEDVLKARKEHPTDRKDLLSAMLNGVDTKTGKKLSDSSIIDNLITFLIAGHETTSGLLSFAFYQLLAHPEAYRKAQQEVDEVCGTGAITIEHMKKLPYISAILRETLRLCPTIPIVGVEAKNDEVLGGKYHIPKGQPLALLLAKSHVDPTVYGETANEFIPERMLDENFDRLNKEFPDCWKPFGNGMRACIGRPFAWQEALLVMAMLLQNFNFLHDDPSYTLQYKQTLTTKPKDFYMRAVLRNGLTPTELEHRLAGGQDTSSITRKPTAGLASMTHSAKTSTEGKGKPMSIYYGSNTGTCEALAQRLAADASSHGFSAKVVDPMDAANQSLPKDQPVVIITASYEGQPPDNAALFCGWIESLKGNELENVSYAVFGCGHHDWAQTFHRIPKLVDNTVQARGGARICDMGLTDAAQGEMFTDFEQWEDETFWPAMEAKYGTTAQGADSGTYSPSLSVTFSTPRSSTLRQDVKEALVVATEELTAPGTAAPKTHIEIQLPSDVRYSAGDYLAVLPINPKETVNRAMRRFQLAWDAHITIEADRGTTLPTNIPVPVYDVLGAYVELAQPATKRSILALSEAAKDSATKESLQNIAGAAYTTEVSRKRVSILDLLEKFPSVALPFGSFLALLPPMRVRQYSISSSPLWNPNHVTLTYSLLEAPALSNPEQKHVGVATSYLASLTAGDKLNVSVRPSHTAFHLPLEAEKTPIICIAAGTGLAPFKGFIQERAAQIGAGRNLAPAILFFGCRGKADDLYRGEFDRWEKMGAVDVRRAYSREDAEEACGCKHVDDRLWHDRKDVLELWDRGAKVYVCGSREVGESVKKVVVRIGLESQKSSGKEPNEEKALKWFESIRNERYATDVFD
ncbi:putative bifunctional P-450:NADPH-P450 reductase [Diplogelasinospora grovesii]|uniref:Bifunctional cytochrome P450/NADPH--P450 reductase n=1 Tax=Diplogelasinospora grovesii TaxID=303347 RepID=A0AAN6S2R5_9PEZI|nr:putative bifunctional P-450:NADPH-P450 reductase [Diplogelasinospora grovesii]